jgi:hypothetical protein
MEIKNEQRLKVSISNILTELKMMSNPPIPAWHGPCF